MNILEKLKEKNITENIRYYGKDDWATGISVSNFLQEKEMIIDLYDFCELNNIDDYINYLFGCYILNFNEIIDCIREDKKDEFKEFYNNFKSKFKYTKKNVIRYINENYLDIYTFNKEDGISSLHLDMKKETTDFVARHYSAIGEDAKEYILKNRFINIIDSFEIWIKHVKDYNIFEYIFCVENLNDYFEVRDTDIYDSLIKLNNYPILKNNVESFVEQLYVYVSENYFDSTEKGIWNTCYRIDDFYEFLLKIDSKYINKLAKIRKEQQQLLEKEIRLKGKIIPINLDLKPFIQFFEDDTKPWEVKIIFTTHYRNKDGKIISFFESAIENKVSSISDIISKKKIDTNDFFSPDIIRSIDLYLFEIKGRLLVLFEKENNLEELFSDLFGEIRSVYEKLNINIYEQKIDVLYDMLYKYIEKIFTIDNQELLNDVYGASNLMCGLIEKLLRDVFMDNTDSEFVIKTNLTIGSLINNLDNNCLTKIYGEKLLRCIRYYLGNDDKYKLVGHAIRNELSHLNDGIVDKLNKDLVLTLMSILLCLINSTVLYYCFNSKI